MSYQKLPQQMIGMTLVFLLLVGCGAPAATPVSPTATPVPPTPAKPKPGATLVGTIAMDRAKSAQITLKVSDDGQTIKEVWVKFTELKCEVSEAGSRACASWQWGTVTWTDLDCKAFSAGSLSIFAGYDIPITDGKFEFKSSHIGEISGKFTSPTAVQGTVHLAFFGGKAECGTWEWSAK